MERYIGGEFYYELKVEEKQTENLHDKGNLDCVLSEEALYANGRMHNFLSGGSDCLGFICRILKREGCEKLLIPEYICPTVLDCLDREKMGYTFYKVNNEFSIDLESIKSELWKVQGLLYLDYFGFCHNEKTLSYILDLKNSGLHIIHDMVQKLSMKGTVSNFSFNSIRKYTPYDGGYIEFDKKYRENAEHILKEMEKTEDSLLQNNLKRLEMIRIARQLKSDFILSGQGEEKEYLELFEASEDSYRRKVISIGDAEERMYFERLNLFKLRAQRCKNYIALQRLLKENKDIYIPFSDIKYTDFPLGMPIFLTGGKRDGLRKHLKERNIFLPIHWQMDKAMRIPIESCLENMINNELTLVIDQRYGYEDMEKLAKAVVQYLEGIG